MIERAEQRLTLSQSKDQPSSDRSLPDATIASMTDKPLVFVSCGQVTAAEIKLGKDLILGFGDKAQVLEPVALRAHVAGELTRAVGRYGHL